MGGASSVNLPPVKDLMSAAPVGVVISIGSSVQRTGEPSRISSVAGPGTGRRPWAASTTPVPMGRGPQLTEAASSSSSATQLPTTSTIESTAPTSWKVTSSGALSCTVPSAFARSWKAFTALLAARSGRLALSTSRRMSANVRWECSSGCSTARRRARTPLISTVSTWISNGTSSFFSDCDTSASGAPAEAKAPKVISPAAPPTGWKWTCVLVVVALIAGHLASHQEGDGEEYGQQDEGTGIAPYGVGEGRGIPFLAGLAG